MTTLVRCVNGHEWQDDSPSGTISTCPICGVGEHLLSPPTFPEARPSSPLSGDSLARDVAQGPPELANFEILEELGRGGMGIVYKARRRDSGDLIALKVLRKERLGNIDMMNRFRREALASARVQHPNIVEVFDANLEGATPYLAMEYVPGITLQHLVEKIGPLPIAQAADFIRQTAQALQHIADQRLVHRDIKPSNLMVEAPKGLPLPARPVVKILDMGVARLFQLSEQEMSLTTLTRDGSVIGTPDYIAPEQLEDPRKVDFRADLYSLGCTFYFLLTGQLPFPGGSLIQKLDRHRWHTAPSVDQHRRDIPPALAAVVRRLMNKHPDDRYQSPGDLASALETLLRTGALPGDHLTQSLKLIRTFSGHSGTVTAVTFSPDGTWLVSGGSDRTVRIWEVTSGQQRLVIADGKYPVGCLTINPVTGILFAGQGVTVRLLDPLSGKELHRLTGHNNAVRCVSLSADGRKVVTGADDRTVRLWDLDRNREIQRFVGHRDGLTGVGLSPDGKTLFSCGRDGTFRLWDISNGKEIRSYSVPRGPVMGLAVMPNGKTVYTGHFDTTIRLWDVTSGKETRRFSGHSQMVTCLTSNTEGLLLSGSNDQTIRLWDPGSGAELATGRGHTAGITSVAFHSGGKLVASSGLDQSVRLWEIEG